jgi:Major Facilitator Superfamily
VTVAPGARWSLLLLLGTLTMIDIMSIDLSLPAFPAIARTLHASTSEVQATLSVFVFGLAGGQVLYGPVFDRFGRRAPLLFGELPFRKEPDPIELHKAVVVPKGDGWRSIRRTAPFSGVRRASRPTFVNVCMIYGRPG